MTAQAIEVDADFEDELEPDLCWFCDEPGSYRPREAATLCDAHAPAEDDEPSGLLMRDRLLAQDHL